MLVPADQLGPQDQLRAQVCVVGAGPAGLAVASRLASAGISVLVLEASGDSADAADRTSGAGAAAGPPDAVHDVGLAYRVPDKTRRGLGGGALAWNVRTPVGEPFLRLWELDELDFASRPGVREAGWPLAKADLAGAYRDAWALYGLPAPGERGPRPTATGDVEVRPYRFGPASTFTERLPRQLAASPTVRVVTGVVVTDVRTDGDAGVVSSLRCATTTGRPLTVEADAYVLAGGGIETPRLLLASRSRSAEGLGNAGDHVGRYFMEHPHFDSAVLRPIGASLDEDPTAWDVHEVDGLAVQHKFGLTQEAVEREGLLSAAYYVEPRRPGTRVVPGRDGRPHPGRTAAVHAWRTALHRRHLPERAAATAAVAVTALPALVRDAAARVLAERAVRAGRPAGGPPRTMTLRAMVEQVPDRSSRVRLRDGVDALGMPVAELDWRVTALDRWSMARTQELLSPLLAPLLGSRVDPLVDLVPRPWITGGAHQIGTTRMSASARDGVVDRDCRVHGIRNLYVAGSSVFPTSGSANPTLTLVALAVRLGDHLRGELAPARVQVAGRG